MDDVVEGVLAYLRGVAADPPPAGVPTRDVLSALRARLDADAPGWRGRALGQAGGPDAVEVEVRLPDGRVVRGTLARRPGEAA